MSEIPAGMMGTLELLELVRDPNIKLIENLCDRELNNPEGSGFDVRVGQVHMLEGEGGYTEADTSEKEMRKTPPTRLVAEVGKDNQFVLGPNQYVLITLMESLNLPDNINVIPVPRSTLLRSGVGMKFGTISPGYKGPLTFGLYNYNSARNFTFELGARLAHLYFFRTGTNVRSYSGQWQHGRVSTQGESEKQV